MTEKPCAGPGRPVPPEAPEFCRAEDRYPNADGHGSARYMVCQRRMPCARHAPHSEDCR